MSNLRLIDYDLLKNPDQFLRWLRELQACVAKTASTSEYKDPNSNNVIIVGIQPAGSGQQWGIKVYNKNGDTYTLVSTIL